MPLMVPFEFSKKWLYDLSDEIIQEIISSEMPSEKLDYYSVFSIRGRKPRLDIKEKDEQYEWKIYLK